MALTNPLSTGTSSTAGRGEDMDVIVIGAGLAGLMAAVHAVNAGARVRLISQGWGQQMVTPGWISVCDRAEDDVIAEVRGYAALHPEHPYGRAGDDAMVAGLESFRSAAEAVGLPYEQRKKDGHNMRLITLLGAVQRAMIAPRGIAAGDLTDLRGPLLIVGFAGWRDFYPELTAGNLRRQGIDARAIEVELPDQNRWWDYWPGDLARLFDSAGFRESIARQVAPHVGDAERVGFPAVLGMDDYPGSLDDLSQKIGRPVFEIPTLPASTAGVRLSERLRRWLLRKGARVQIGHPVLRGVVEGRRCVGVEVASLGHPTLFRADRFILATGGVYNGGIQTDESGRVWEPLFDLPVVIPEVETRADWYHDTLLIERGHPIHRETGLRVNTDLQPLDVSGEPALENVYATGQLLAGFNPLTDGCAEGIALATAYKAVHTALELDA